MNLWLSVYTAIFKTDNQQGPLYSTWQPGWEGSFKGEWIHVYDG